MKRVLHLIIVVLLFAINPASGQMAQVIADFEDPGAGLAGWEIGWSDYGVATAERIEHQQYGGVVQLNCSYETEICKIGFKNENLYTGWTETVEGAEFITVDLFIPADFPGGAGVQFAVMDRGTWNWQSVWYTTGSYAGGRKLMPGTWNRIVCEFKRVKQVFPDWKYWDVFTVLEFHIAEDWTGSVLIDNVIIWLDGEIVSDFSQNIDGYGTWDKWIELSHTEGALVGTYDTPDDTAAFVSEPDAIVFPDPFSLTWTETIETNLLAADLFVPSDFPDSSYFQFFQMDKTHWGWVRTLYSPVVQDVDGVNTTLIGKGAWNTIVFEVKRQNQSHPDSYFPWVDIYAGIEVDLKTVWTGSLLLDNVRLFNFDAPTGIEDISVHAANFELMQNYPNPFNPITTIAYSIPKTSEVKLVVYDILGREVAVMVNDVQNPGYYKYTFSGDGLSSGVYVYRLETTDRTIVKKMLLLK